MLQVTRASIFLTAGERITAPDAAPPASANVNSETHYLFSPASTRSIRGWNGSACRTWKRPRRPSSISRWSGKSGLKLAVPPLASTIRDGVPGCLFRFDEIETGLWNHDAAEGGVLSGPACRDGPWGGRFRERSHCSEPGNRSICGDLGLARRTRANDRNSLSRDQATPHHIEIVRNIEIVPGPNPMSAARQRA